jgi:hypothetical protein
LYSIIRDISASEGDAMEEDNRYDTPVNIAMRLKTFHHVYDIYIGDIAEVEYKDSQRTNVLVTDIEERGETLFVRGIDLTTLGDVVFESAHVIRRMRIPLVELRPVVVSLKGSPPSVKTRNDQSAVKLKMSGHPAPPKVAPPKRERDPNCPGCQGKHRAHTCERC